VHRNLISINNKTDNEKERSYECFNACLNEPDLNARKNCVGGLVECAMMCQMSAAMMSISGKFQDDHCKECAAICRECAEECRKMASM
jgi:hypothetical protein